jgi:RNA polymerase sigma factor (sigma-70 family)
MNTPLPLQVVQRIRGLAAPDSQLLQAFLNRRDDEAFAELVRRHGPMVYSVCRRLLSDPHAADDAFQATFLVLAKKAPKLTDQSSAAPWLYGVACRVARRARRAWCRRRVHESRAVAPAGSAAPDAAWEELRLVLDEELNRLPEGLRAPLILCYLQGRTRDEAAAQLGCTFGALKRRLEDGRALLRSRLARRGVTLAVTGLAAAVSESELPAALVEQTLTVVHGAAAPAAVADLIPSAFAARWKVLIAAAVVVGTIVTGTIIAIPAKAPTDVPRALPKAEPPKEPEIKRDWFNDRLPDGAVARLGSTAFCHGDMARGVVYSSEGKRLLSLGHASACVWDATTGQLLAEFPRPGHFDWWLEGAFLGDKNVCLTLNGGVAHVYDVETRKELSSFDVFDGERRRPGGLKFAAFTPDGRLLAAPEGDDGIRIWDVQAGIRGRLLKADGKLVRSVALAGGVKSLAALDEHGTVRVWSVSTGQQLAKFETTDREIGRFVLSSDGNWIATVCQTTTHSTYEGTRFSSTAADGHFELWDVIKGVKASQIEAYQRNIGCIRFAPDCRSAYTGGYGLEPYVRRWDLKTGKMLLELPRFGNAIQTLDVSADGKSLVTGGIAVLRTWDVETGKEKLPIDAHRSGISDIVLLPNCHAMTAGGEGELRTWDLMTGKPLKRIEALPSATYISNLARSLDGRLAVTNYSEENPEVHLLDASGNKLRTFKGKDKAIMGLAFSPDGALLAAADHGGSVFLWGVESGRELRTLKTAGQRAGMLAFTPDGKRLLSAAGNDPFCIWDVASGERTHTWDPHAVGLVRKGGLGEDLVMGLAYSDDRKYLAMGIQGRSRLLICDVDTGKLVKELNVHQSGVPFNVGTPLSPAFSPDGKRIAWGTWEGPIYVHDWQTGAEVAQFTGHRGRVLHLVFTPDGRHLVSCSEDSTALVWAMPK